MEGLGSVYSWKICPKRAYVSQRIQQSTTNYALITQKNLNRKTVSIQPVNKPKTVDENNFILQRLGENLGLSQFS